MMACQHAPYCVNCCVLKVVTCLTAVGAILPFNFKYMTESLKGRETEVDRWKDGETHWNKQAIGLHEEKKKKNFNSVLIFVWCFLRRKMGQKFGERWIAIVLTSLVYLM